MEMSNIVNRTTEVSCLDIRLELPPNQVNPNLSQHNLLGELISSKVIGFNSVKDVVLKAWRPTCALEVKRLGGNVYLFNFQHKADLHKAFLRRPWSIRGGHLILKKWSSELTWLEIDFSLSSFWVQVHSLPRLWKSEDNLKAIGRKLEVVLEVNFNGKGGGEWRRFTRVRVGLDISKPLILGFFLPRPNLKDLWISLKYEMLADICYNCGIIGHEESKCVEEIFCLQNSVQAPFKAARPWLRTDFHNPQDGLFDMLNPAQLMIEASTDATPIRLPPIQDKPPCQCLTSQHSSRCPSMKYDKSPDPIQSQDGHSTMPDTNNSMVVKNVAETPQSHLPSTAPSDIGSTKDDEVIHNSIANLWTPGVVFGVIT